LSEKFGFIEGINMI